MTPAVRRAADRRPRLPAKTSSARRRSGSCSSGSPRSSSRRSASTAGSATARRRASAGATISMTRASRRRSRCPTGCSRCARRRAAFAGLHARRLRPCPARPLRSRRRHRLAPRPRRVRAGRRHFARTRRRRCASASARRQRLQARQPRGRAALGLSALRRSRAAIGSTASRPASSCASRSPSARCRTKGRRIAAQQGLNGTAPRPERFCAPCARLLLFAAAPRGLLERAGGRPAVHQRRRARSRAEWALVNEQAAQRPVSRRPTSKTMRKQLREQLQTAASSLTQPTLALRRRRSGRCCASPTTRRPRSCARTPTSSSRSRTALNPLELTLGIMTAVGGFVDISELVFAAKAGSIFGYALIWVFAFSTIGIMRVRRDERPRRRRRQAAGVQPDAPPARAQARARHAGRAR